jgi:predicted DNA-binding protein YlxM (UPF0122 family)
MVVDFYSSDHAVKDLSSKNGVSKVAIYKWIKNILQWT